MRTAAEPGDIWWSADQCEIDTLALSLLDHPEVVAARARAAERYRSSPEFAFRDAPTTLSTAVDNLLFSSLQFGVLDEPGRPKVLWSVRRPYIAGGRAFPGSHYGADNPDRVYRMVGVSPAHRYRISGRRHPTHPTEDDLSLESIPGPGLWGQPTVRLPRTEIDINIDGSFSVIADGTQADGRRNHLYLPPETKCIVVRDTLLDWSSQVPNQVRVELLDGPEVPPRDADTIVRTGVAIFEQSVELALGFLRNCLRTWPANELVAFERAVEWGMAGGLFAVNRFDLGADEALLITVEQLGARYLTINACDPWTTASDYDSHCASLNNFQARPNADGSYTFVLSPTDPGVFNWVDTVGLRTGTVVARWEGMSQRPPATVSDDAERRAWAPGTRIVESAVREARVLPVRDVAAAAPHGQPTVSPDERNRLVAARVADHQVRVTGLIVTPGADA
jgi:hypothetical protein